MSTPFCLTVTGTGWILPKSSQKEKQVLGLSATSAPRVLRPSQGLWDAAASISSLETGKGMCQFQVFTVCYKIQAEKARVVDLLCREELWWGISDVLLKAEFTLLNELSLISSWHFPGAYGNVKGLSSACPSHLVEAERRLSPTRSPLSVPASPEETGM